MSFQFHGRDNSKVGSYRATKSDKWDKRSGPISKAARNKSDARDDCSQEYGRESAKCECRPDKLDNNTETRSPHTKRNKKTKTKT